jgi:glycosyltransferase involved in cell wall biosynthesis
MKFSVVLLTYNSDWLKTKRTLASIVSQKDVDFELVVSDDGSRCDNFEKIEQFLKDMGFTDYTLLGNKDNAGTVKNLLAGLRAARGEYVKDISPGDLFYDEFALSRISSFIEIERERVYFGKTYYYSFEAGNIRILEKCNPVDLRPYIKNDQRQIRENYLLFRDYVLGASFVIARDTYIKYLEKIEGTIKFTEDCSVIYMVSEKVPVKYCDRPLLWYEYGDGISTSGSDKWASIIEDEQKKLFGLIALNGQYQKMMNSINWPRKARTLRKIERVLLNPRQFFFFRSRLGLAEGELGLGQGEALKKMLDLA